MSGRHTGGGGGVASVVDFSFSANIALFSRSCHFSYGRLHIMRLKRTVDLRCQQQCFFPAASTRLPHGFLERNGRKLQHRRKTIWSTCLYTTKQEFYTYQQWEGVLSTEAQGQCRCVLTSSSDFLLGLLMWYFSDRDLMFTAALCLWAAVFEQSNQNARRICGAGPHPHLSVILQRSKKRAKYCSGPRKIWKNVYKCLSLNPLFLYQDWIQRSKYTPFKHQRANTGLLHMIPRTEWSPFTSFQGLFILPGLLGWGKQDRCVLGFSFTAIVEWIHGIFWS